MRDEQVGDCTMRFEIKARIRLSVRSADGAVFEKKNTG
jgi:hypothetical protein